MCAAGSPWAPRLTVRFIDEIDWRQGKRWMYEATSKTRLSRGFGVHGPFPTVLTDSTTISNGATASPARPALNYYRTGRDSVAPHR